jgi:hypothetical protein
MKKFLSVILAICLIACSFVMPTSVLAEDIDIDMGENYLEGDVNGDSLANLYDLVLLAQVVAKWHGLSSYVSEACDTNNDGATDAADVARLAQFLAGWNVEIF